MSESDDTRIAELRWDIATESIGSTEAVRTLGEALDRVEQYEALLRKQRDACCASGGTGDCEFCRRIDEALEGAWS